MNKVKSIFTDETKRNIFFLVLSGIALIVSFFDVGHLPVNVAWISIVLCGVPIVVGAIKGLITEFDIKADVLVSMALIASVIIGEIFAAGEVAFIMQIGALLEELTVAKAQAGIEKLVHLTPRTARVIREGKEEIIDAKKVQVGDILRVVGGETIAVDGIITKGQTSIDQSVMTGESMPVDKSLGDEVSSGTVNQFGTFEMKAIKVGEDSSLQRMIRLVQSADAGKAKIVGIADRWATWIVVIAVTAAILTWIITGEIIRAVTILVVFCPCALVLATPTAIMAAIGNATKYGILVREGDALERLSKVKKIVFDKTGTLTYGKPEIVTVKSFSDNYTDKDLYEVLASAELRSEHPLGKAVVECFRQTGNISTEPEKFTMLPGRGVLAKVNGKKIFAGNEKLMKDNHIFLKDEVLKEAKSYLSKGCTIIYISIDNIMVGFSALSDTLRKNAPYMIRNIKTLGITPVLLTGDHAEAAGYISNKIGISEVKADCLPEDKLDTIHNIQIGGEMVCMVGDGVNDAPALKKAYVGIAMGGVGSDIAVDAADIALVSDNISQLPYLFELSKKMMTTIKINLSFSMILNFAAIILAITGVLNPIVGALVHNAGSVLVIINSALLLKWKKKSIK
ncbi:cation-translocating P-type ATPase [Clostridium botulinum]|uniref:Cd(2+)-exporting ATPase n=2 Tax=Clostridium botulinum TaxID=1491 RepID=A0A846I021_CLOBO|nr:cation-translocating P-type ATPase [Clostridium botulinum]ACQ54368.1 cadmium-exporting ATPase [Clostridium botulinum Ba4 str. 657]AJE12905.1 copper-translocating P-type ATPase [Clostridium botulinum CDC_1436]AXG90728.1 cation-transporting P-type ATPase [Clostridium botulinum]EDT85026.1 cadmium-exporting ATPase [Clostridium botulinum Bf]MBY6879435.1 cation-translocating P-type ATPase [Clostridium botulinum]